MNALAQKANARIHAVHPIVVFIFGCLATGVIVAFGAYYAGIKTAGLLLAIGIAAAGTQALVFLIWYLLHTRKVESQSNSLTDD